MPASRRRHDILRCLFRGSRVIDMLGFVLISDETEQALVLVEQGLRINASDYLVCPGFVNPFPSICQQAHDTKKNPIQLAGFPARRSPVVDSRPKVICGNLETLLENPRERFSGLCETGIRIRGGRPEHAKRAPYRENRCVAATGASALPRSLLVRSNAMPYSLLGSSIL